jgi:hypothetical protein
MWAGFKVIVFELAIQPSFEKGKESNFSLCHSFYMDCK